MHLVQDKIKMFPINLDKVNLDQLNKNHHLLINILVNFK